MVVGPGAGSFLLLPLPLLVLPRGGVVLLADAARVALAEASSPPAPSRRRTRRFFRMLPQVVLAVILALFAVVVTVLSAVYAWTFWRKAPEALDSKEIKPSSASKGTQGKLNSLKTSKKEVITMMDFSVLESATSKFNEKNILGKGGFGCVYRACLDKSGAAVAAVKKLNCCREEVEKEFENELDFLGKIWHPNVISVLGYCIHEDTRLLVYELMQNGSLETQLHGPSRGSALSWHVRLKIALDTARGLEHLHEHCNPMIIHRDIKSSNILLDSDFNAKISDFGLAIYGGNYNKDVIKPSGTFGYVRQSQLTWKEAGGNNWRISLSIYCFMGLFGRAPTDSDSLWELIL
ncbi:hypothetical protein C2845_PM01G32160 [Panicum miliaceum]|uniref:non-specific serine/threonine protein kinase n=1 Tax=Panicum miliaceum TaxID=4540 RepID=A0A3L6TSJ1_PANMI|nr:hypothetical protein C2845_PM01G32160 [Panicum miliaceum]